MKEKHIASVSFGKDSLATILLAKEHGEPLDEAVYCEVMFDKDISGEVPEHRDFIYGTAIPVLERMGTKIIVFGSGYRSRRAGTMTCRMISRRSSSMSLSASCWQETTTAAIRWGLPLWYSTDTWAFPSGPRPRMIPVLRALVRNSERGSVVRHPGQGILLVLQKQEQERAESHLSISASVLGAAEGTAGPDPHAHEALQPEGCPLRQCV